MTDKPYLHYTGRPKPIVIPDFEAAQKVGNAIFNHPDDVPEGPLKFEQPLERAEAPHADRHDQVDRAVRRQQPYGDAKG